MTLTLVRAVAVSMSIVPILLCQTDDETRSLRGITSFHVIVAIDGGTPGLSRDELQTDAELALRQNGITVYKSALEAPSRSSHGSLRISIVLLNQEDGLYAFSVIFYVRQVAAIPRIKEPLLLTTWTTDTLGTIGKDKISQIRTVAVNDLIKRFLNDYLSVNPKK